MSDRPRFVIDTNVLIDAVCFEGSFGMQAYVLALAAGEIVVSQPTFAEFASVLMRPKFERFVGLNERRVALASISRDVSWITPWCHYRVCRDPSDDKFIDLGVCAGASTLITRDADLLALDPFNGIGIVEAEAFVVARSERN